MGLRRAPNTRRRSIRAVFFDIGGTLVHVQPSVGAVYAAAAAERGVAIEPDVLQHRFTTAWKVSQTRSQKRSLACTDQILRDEWRVVVRQTFDGLLPENLHAPVFEDLYERFVGAGAWSLAPGAREALSYLHSAGLKLGVVSNWDSRLRRTLQGLGILAHFDFVVASHEVGYEKPHPAMFQRALEFAGEPPASALHVGDSLDADILPARALGMRALWVGRAQLSESLPPAPADALHTTSLSDLTRDDWERLLE
jgi:putative hydrolase of the HAD superfamily